MKPQDGLLIFCALVLFGCSDGATVKGNGKSRTEVREVKSFDRLDAHLASYFSFPLCKYWVTIDGNLAPRMKGKDGPATVPVKITADENLLPLIKTEVVGDQLKMDLVRDVSTDLGIRVEYWSSSPSGSSSGCTKTTMSIGSGPPSLEKSK